MGLLSILARMSLNAAPFIAGVNSAKNAVDKFGQQTAGSLKNQVGSLVAFGAIAGYVKQVINAASHLDDLSKATGVSTTMLQEMEFAAKQNGVSLDEVAQSFKKLADARREALLDPKSKQGQAFAAVGITDAELKSKSIEELWKTISRTIETTDFGQSELTIVTELLGRSAMQLIPLMKDGIDEAAKAAREFGSIIGPEIVQQLDAAGDAADRLALRFRAQMAPAITFALDKMKEFLDFLNAAGAFVGGFIGDNGEGPNGEKLSLGDSLKKRLQTGLMTATEHYTEELDKANEPVIQKASENRTKKAFEFTKPEEKLSGRGQGGNFAPISDSLLSIGNFLGANPASQQLQQLGKIEGVLKEIRDNQKRANGTSFPL